MKTSAYQTTTNSAVVGQAETKRLLALEEQKRKLTEQLHQVTTESNALYNVMRSRISPEFLAGGFVIGPLRKMVQKPRPVADKLVISAGRAIVVSLKQKLSADEAKTHAIEAATKVARRYGLEELPGKVITSIDQRIKSRYNLFN